MENKFKALEDEMGTYHMTQFTYHRIDIVENLNFLPKGYRVNFENMKNSFLKSETFSFDVFEYLIRNWVEGNIYFVKPDDDSFQYLIIEDRELACNMILKFEGK